MVFIVSLSILLVDQATKLLATKLLTLNSPLSVIDGFFYLTLVHNRGAAFGIFKNQLFLFIPSALIAIILLAATLKDKRRITLFSFALALILAGAAGNLLDRVFCGFVIDFLDFRIWPVFNIADSAITVGAVLVGWQLVFKKDDAHNL